MSDPDHQKTDIAQLRVELLDAEDELRRLQSVYNNSPDPYGQLSARREDLERIAFSCQIALRVAPHKKLPPELLAEVFLLCTTFPNPTTLPPTMTDHLFVLTRVCHAWRELALHLPDLWANISVSFDREDIDVERVTHITERWLSRANDPCPLGITAECTSTYASAVPDKPELLSGFMALVLSHAPRLKQLDLTFPSATLRPLFSLPEGSFPQLETISLQPHLFETDLQPTDSGRCGWHWPGATTAFGSATCLREVTFSPKMPWTVSELGNLVGTDALEQIIFNDVTESTPIWFAPTVSLPWSKIRVLRFGLTACTPDVWCSVLSGCPDVEHCDLAVRPGYSNDPPIISPPISLLRLFQLYLFASDGAGDQLLESLVAPKLSILTLVGHIVPLTMSSFKTRSNFELQAFVMMLHIAEDDVELLFQNLPDLKILLIPLISTEYFPASIWDRVGRAELLPQLETLVIQPRPAQIPVLVDMIAGNWERAASSGRTALEVKFWSSRADHLAAVNEGLKGLEKYAAAGNAVEISVVEW